MLNQKEEIVRKQFEDKVSAYITRERLFCDSTSSGPVIVAVSGGADSVALLAVLLALGYECLAVHCNFHLRGEESMRDQHHVENMCRRLGVRIKIRDFNVGERMSATGESLEMACRELRYDWFHELRILSDSMAIAVGHHKEDQAETVLLNLMRGSGIAGIAGMRPRNGYVVRPLLECSRGEIEDYVEVSGLSYIVDSSNASDKFRRNRVRNQLLPYFESLFPGATDGILRSASNLADNRDFYFDMVAERQKIWLRDNRIDICELLYRENNPRILLFEILSPYGFNMTQVRNMIDSVGCSGRIFDSTDGTCRIELSRGILSLYKDAVFADAGCYDVSLDRDITCPVAIGISTHDIKEFRPTHDGGRSLYMDISAFEGCPRWQLRKFRKGDRMHPFGMKGSKLVSDIFSDAKYSLHQKREAWILTRNDEILWIPGLRASSRFAVGPNTGRYVRLEFNDRKNHPDDE